MTPKPKQGRPVVRNDDPENPKPIRQNMYVTPADAELVREYRDLNALHNVGLGAVMAHAIKAAMAVPQTPEESGYELHNINTTSGRVGFLGKPLVGEHHAWVTPSGKVVRLVFPETTAKPPDLHVAMAAPQQDWIG